MTLGHKLYTNSSLQSERAVNDPPDHLSPVWFGLSGSSCRDSRGARQDVTPEELTAAQFEEQEHSGVRTGCTDTSNVM